MQAPTGGHLAGEHCRMPARFCTPSNWRRGLCSLEDMHAQVTLLERCSSLYFRNSWCGQSTQHGCSGMLCSKRSGAPGPPDSRSRSIKQICCISFVNQFNLHPDLCTARSEGPPSLSLRDIISRGAQLPAMAMRMAAVFQVLYPYGWPT